MPLHFPPFWAQTSQFFTPFCPWPTHVARSAHFSLFSRATKAHTGLFWPVQPPSGWNSPKISKPSGREHLQCSKACPGERLRVYIKFCPSHFYFFWGKNEIHVWWHRSWCLELLCAMRRPPNASVLLGTGDGVELFFPHSVLQKVWVTGSLPMEKGWDWHVGEAEEQDVLILARVLFIVSVIELSEEGRNWPGWQSRLIRHFLSAPYPSKTSG